MEYEEEEEEDDGEDTVVIGICIWHECMISISLYYYVDVTNHTRTHLNGIRDSDPWRMNVWRGRSKMVMIFINDMKII